MRTLVFLGCALLFFVLVNGTAKEYSHEFTEEDYRTIFPNNEDNMTLKLVIVMFRHGNRTPDGETELYPNDPYLNFSYFPYGLGQLTNAGKVKEYNLGVTLRNRYDSFLGDYYYPNIVEAISTDYNRTKMSIQLVLAGLFPPRKEEMMTVNLSWQPVPYNYLPREEDRVLMSTKCPKYQELFNKYVSLPKIQQRFKKHATMFDYLSNQTGLTIDSFYDIYNLYFGLSTEEEFGLTLPDWTKSVWPEPIHSLATEEYFISMGYPDMRRILVGYFLDKVLKDVYAKINDDKKLSRKIHLYSAHENNVAQLLIALGIYEKHVPAYGSHIILELHKIDDVYGLKIFYEGCDGRGARLMKIAQCDEFCPLNTFQSLVHEYLPIDPNICGN